MDVKQEPKYRAVAYYFPPNDGLQTQFVDGVLINRKTGEQIPPDEPVFILRARDVHAVEVLELYRRGCLNEDHRAAVESRIADFDIFRIANPGRMKEPD